MSGKCFLLGVLRSALFTLTATIVAACSSGAPSSSAAAGGANVLPLATGSGTPVSSHVATTTQTSTAALAAYWGGAYMFQTDLSSTYPMLNQAATANSRVNLRIWHDDPMLQFVIPWSHTHKLADSLSSMTTLSQQKPGAAAIIYDIEHWSSTPVSEQQNPVASIEQAGSIARSYGKLAGTAPDGEFIGIKPSKCSFDIGNGVVPGVNWKDLDIFNVQAQMLASDSRCGTGNVTQYLAFLKQVVSMVRNENPNIVITAQISLADSSPTTALAAIAAAEGIGVNAIYVAYPASCTTCTLSALTTVLSAL